jgi:hypothetical protein
MLYNKIIFVALTVIFTLILVMGGIFFASRQSATATLVPNSTATTVSAPVIANTDAPAATFTTLRRHPHRLPAKPPPRPSNRQPRFRRCMSGSMIPFSRPRRACPAAAPGDCMAGRVPSKVTASVNGPAGALQLCALVANGNHSMIVGSGNCVDLH